MGATLSYMSNVNRDREQTRGVEEMKMTLIQAQTLGSLTVNDIVKVYSGRPSANGNHCRCGCRGTYRYSSGIDIAKERGYEGDATDVNDKQVAKVLAIVQASATEAADDCSWFDAEVYGRNYTVYVKAEARL